MPKPPPQRPRKRVLTPPGQPKPEKAKPAPKAAAAAPAPPSQDTPKGSSSVEEANLRTCAKTHVGEKPNETKVIAEEPWDNSLCGACGQPLPKVTPDAPPTLGRPTDYDEGVVTRILERISEGEPLARICTEQQNYPARSTFLGWVTKDREGLYDRYTRARLLMIDSLADDCVEIADNCTSDIIMTDKGPRFDGNNVRRAEVMVSTRKWLLSKLDPSRFGDRLDLHHSGSINTGEMSDEDINVALEDALIMAGVPDNVMDLVRGYLRVIPLPVKDRPRILPMAVAEPEKI